MRPQNSRASAIELHLDLNSNLLKSKIGVNDDFETDDDDDHSVWKLKPESSSCLGIHINTVLGANPAANTVLSECTPLTSM